MTTPIQIRVGMPMDEFIREYDLAPFELIDGERIPRLPTVAEHGEIMKLLVMAFLAFEQTYQRISTIFEIPFVLSDSPDWVMGSRVPDIMIYEASRMTAYRASEPNWRSKPYLLVPDLCIEIVSKNDNVEDVLNKARGYLADGVNFVWVVIPRTRVVFLYTAGSSQITELNENDVLTNADLLPNFSFPIADLFKG